MERYQSQLEDNGEEIPQARYNAVTKVTKVTKINKVNKVTKVTRDLRM